MDRRWRFVYDGERTGQWGWQMHEGARLAMASMCAFPTLDGCIDHARAAGFSFAQRYDILYSKERASGGADSPG